MLTVLESRTHRERKEAYTKGLENEVVQLRANEARIMQETKELYAEIRLLKNTLRQNGISVPNTGQQGFSGAVIDGALGEQSFSLSIQDARSKSEHQRIHIQKNVANVQQRHQESTPSTADVHGTLVQSNPISNFSQRKPQPEPMHHDRLAH